MRKKVLILGAAGMDYHVFNTVFRDNPNYEVVGFTMAAEQNLGTVGELRNYPKELAGKLYPNGIPTYREEDMEKVIKEKNVDMVVLAYSDISHNYVMHLASRALASGSDFKLIGTKHAMLKSKKPIVAVCAVRTGCGKSQFSQKITEILKKEFGKKVVAIREPMPYGNLIEQKCMRFSSYEDLDKYKCTIEEREEYEAYIEKGLTIYSGVDYGEILKEAEKEAEIIVWDGGNNEISFYVPNLQIVIADPHRAGHELLYHPGEVNARIADVVIINKVNTAKKENVEIVKENIRKINPRAEIIEASSVVKVEQPEKVKGKKVLVIEDGPTLTHGDMPYGAATVAARELNCEIVDPRENAVGSIKETYKNFPHLDKILPAMGYSKEQMKELEDTINKTECDFVLVGTPINLSKLLKINKPAVRVRYGPDEKTVDRLREILKRVI
ncbi:MAG: cyclic 2,3-diphosphoglycerate synthase [Candidatus Altiarchaeota archaeon]